MANHSVVGDVDAIDYNIIDQGCGRYIKVLMMGMMMRRRGRRKRKVWDGTSKTEKKNKER